MPQLWGIHNDQPSLDLINGQFISIGWDNLGDPSSLATDPDALKARLSELYPTAKAGAIPVWAGVLRRFMLEMKSGDLVISPDRASRTLNFGRIVGDYYFDKAATVHANRRRVEWLKTDVPRSNFSQSALNEIGSAVTLFRVRNHADEFLAALDGSSPKTATPEQDAAQLAEDEPNARRVEEYSRDSVSKKLKSMDAFRFEHFVAGLLRAMGYRAAATQATGDGGVDVIASRDPLGVEPPIVKVQCKRTVSQIGGPDVQALVGALASGELGLFVTLGGYTSDALHIERSRQNLRLVTGTQLIDFIFEYYENLDSEWKTFLQLKRVYAVDSAADDM